MQNIKGIAKTVVIFVVSPLIVHFFCEFHDARTRREGYESF